jgi:hypothetical protein
MIVKICINASAKVANIGKVLLPTVTTTGDCKMENASK